VGNWAFVFAVILLALSVAAGADDLSARVGQKGVHSVTSYGAVGDGKADDTQAFQKAIDATSKDDGGIVFVPTGNYLIKTHLLVPQNVTLEGVFRAPTARTQYKGSTLLAVEGKGNAEGEPFIFLRDNATLKGLTIFYPEQDAKKPVPYPWCVRGQGDNCSIVDVLMVNPWQAVDFGTMPCGRHLIKGLYAQPLHKGIFVDKCFDVGRIEDVHLWPFWDASKEIQDFLAKQATAFIFARTDWEFVNNCFCIFYNVGYHFTAFNDGPGNVVITNSGSDIGPTAVLVDNCQGHAGIAWTNCQFMAGVEVKQTNTGPVKFNNCGFWGVQDMTTTHANIKGSGYVTFNECHFTSWDTKSQNQPAILADGKGLTVSSCDFMDSGKKQIILNENLKAAVIMGNHMRGGIKVENKSKGKVEMGLNVDE
jgi:hypothetical protein